MVTVEDLPPEIIERILTYVSPYDDLKSCQQVCSHWYNTSKTVAKRKKTKLRRAITNGSLDLQSPLIPVTESVISHRFAHCAAIEDSNMYVFGGCSNTFTTYNDLWRFDLSSNKWSRLLTSGTYPSPKAYSSLVAWKQKLFLLGGWSHPTTYPIFQGVTLYDEFYMYDITGNEWKIILLPHGPGACAGHGATIHKDRMVVFGGIHSQDQAKPSNLLHCYDLVTELWTIPTVTGPSPGRRYGHSQVAIDDNHMLVIGGFGHFKQTLKDIWLLDMSGSVWEWVPIEIQGTDNQPPDICFSPVCKIGEKVVMISSSSSDKTDCSINQILQKGASRAMGLTNQVRFNDLYEQLHAVKPLNINPTGQKPSIRPNASDDKRKRNMMLSKAERRIKVMARRSHENNTDGISCSSRITTYLIDIKAILEQHTATFTKCQQKISGHHKSKYVTSDYLHTLLLGRGHLIMFGGITYHPNNTENSVSNCLFYVTPANE